VNCAPVVLKSFTIHAIPLHCFRKVSWGDVTMVKTIAVGNYVSIQGLFVRALSDGRIVVRVGKDEFVGRPVSATRLAA